MYHLALAKEWEAARASGSYERSTLDRSLADVGFIHCAFARQVRGVADAFYAGQNGIVLLEIDPDKLTSEVRLEEAPGTGDSFPHIYGPLNTNAVVSVTPTVLGTDGRLVLPPSIG